MTRTTNARIAGLTFLFYIATGVLDQILFRKATNAEGTAAKLALIAQHVPDVRAGIVLVLCGCFSALVLAVALYGLTRDVDYELAMLGLACRVGEGVLGATSLSSMVGLLQLVTAAGTTAPDAASANALGTVLLKVPFGDPGAIFFAVGSTIFSYLLLRGRMVPNSLAWLGVVASVLLVVLLPAQLVGLVGGSMFYFMWLPMLVAELALALWLLIKGVNLDSRSLLSQGDERASGTQRNTSL